MNVAHLVDTATTATSTSTSSTTSVPAASQNTTSFAQSLAQASEQMNSSTSNGMSGSKNSSQSSSSKKSSDPKTDNVSSLAADAVTAAQLALPALGFTPLALPVAPLAKDASAAIQGIGSASTGTDTGAAANAGAPSTTAASTPSTPSTPAASASPTMTAAEIASLLNQVAGSATNGAGAPDQQLLSQIKVQLDKALQQAGPAQPASPAGSAVVAGAAGSATSPVFPAMTIPVTTPVSFQAAVTTKAQQGIATQAAVKPGMVASQSSDSAVTAHVATSGSANNSGQGSQDDSSAKQGHKGAASTDATTGNSNSNVSAVVTAGNDTAGFRAAMAANNGAISVAPASANVTTQQAVSPEAALQTAAAGVHTTQHDDGVTTVSGAVSGSTMPSIQSARLMQSASQSEMRVGLQSAEFGNITIHTSAAGQTVSTQISVEHPELARELAARLPETQTKFGISPNVEVRISNHQQFSAGTGSNGSSASQDQQAYRQAASTTTTGTSASNSATDAFVSAAAVTRISNQTLASTSNRLDIRA